MHKFFVTPKRFGHCAFFAISTLLLAALSADAQTGACTGAGSAALQPAFRADYSCVSLGSITGLPGSYGGLTLKYDDPNTLLIGGAANQASGRVYQVAVNRDANGHITGFTGTATLYPSAGSTVGAYNDGGVVFGPGNVLFVARYSGNQIEQTKPGSATPDKVIDLSALGVVSSTGSLNFVPAGFPGAGQMKIVSYNGQRWYSATAIPDGSGTYDIGSVTPGPIVGSGPEGIAFVPPSSPVFAPYSVLIALYSAGKVITAPLDANGDPVMASAQDFITGLSGAEGAFIDPLTGDFLFSTFGGGNQIIRVSGFIAPTAGEAAVSGRVMDASGRGISGATISLTATDGKVMSSRTNTFGYYRVDGVTVGETYIAGVSAKRYIFSPRAVSVNDDLAGLDFVAESPQYVQPARRKLF
jgi:hypothetical protein